MKENDTISLFFHLTNEKIIRQDEQNEGRRSVHLLRMCMKNPHRD